MTFNDLKPRGAPSRPSTASPLRVRELAEAGSKGHVLTRGEVKAVCEALRSQSHKVRNQFHSG